MINTEEDDPYVTIEATCWKDTVRGKSKFTLYICTDCLESEVLARADETDRIFKEKILELGEV